MDPDITRVLERFLANLGEISPEFGTPTTPDALQDVANFDFAFHEFILPTVTSRDAVRADLSAQALTYLDGLEADSAPEPQLAVVEAFFAGFEATVRDAAYANFSPDVVPASVVAWIADLHANHQDLLGSLIRYFIRTLANEDVYFDKLGISLSTFMRSQTFSWTGWEVYEFWITVVMGVGFDNPLYDDLAVGFAIANINDPQALTRGQFEFWIWTQLQKPSAIFNPEDYFYPFEVFAPLSINLGLRRLHRQYWRFLGRQKGEVIRTIPLSPGQKERVTTKITRRRKTEQRRETTVERETTTESVDTVKDSSELVNEAASTFNWNVTTSASASFGFVSGSASASVGGTQEDRSRSTNSRLSESMQKAASKLRSETRVIVSTEGEAGFEQERFSEVVNPNNETAITYEYHKLQQKYEVFTQLQEVQSVIFVAETLPPPAAIGGDWARRYDWILARALLDESLRAPLSELSQDAKEEDPLDEASGDPFSEMFGVAQTRFAQFNPPAANQTYAGPSDLTIPDIYAAPQAAFREQLNAAAARRRANAIRDAKYGRLLKHFRDNIVHYQQAIWAAENADQRLLRYSREKRVVPLRWIGAQPTLQPDGTFSVHEIVPGGEAVPLTEIIDPTGPIGYFGNYAVFEISPTLAAPQARVIAMGYQLEMNLAYLLQMTRHPYYDPVTEALLDPGLAAERARQAARHPNGVAQLDDATVFDLITFLPRLADVLAPGGVVARDPGDASHLLTPIASDVYAEYVFRRDTTRRFLVDSNNLYLSLQSGEGAALEPFKRVHRFLDVVKTWQEISAIAAKNERRAALMAEVAAFDPDIEKVVIVPNAATAVAAAGGEAAAARAAPGAAPGPADAGNEETPGNA